MQNDGSVLRCGPLAKLTFVVFLFCASFLLSSQTCLAVDLDLTTSKPPESYLPEPYNSIFPQNNLNGWNPCDDNSEDSGGECVPPTGDKITWIGDSYSTESTRLGDKIRKALPGIDLGDEIAGDLSHPYYNIQSGKHLHKTGADNGVEGGKSGMTVLKEITDANKLRPYLVLALGTNDYDESFDATISYLEEIANLVGDTKVILTTAYAPNGKDYTPSNSAKKAFASTHDNFYVADWAAVAKDKDYADTYHPTEDSYNDWIETIVSALPKDCNSGLLPGDTVPEKVWNWLYNYFNENNIATNIDKSALISGIIGAFSTEAGGGSVEGLTPFAWSSWGGTLLGCIPQYCGNIKDKVTQAVGSDYFGMPTVDGIPEDAIDKAIDLELEFMVNDYNSGISWQTFKDNLGVVSNQTPESYAELFEVIVQNAQASPGAYVEDQGIIDWVNNHPGYGTFQQVLDQKRTFARAAYDKYANRAGSSNSKSKSKSVSSSSSTSSSGSSASKITWDADGWITGGMSGYTKDERSPLSQTKYNSGKPNKILLHYTQGEAMNYPYIDSASGKSVAPHFTIDLLKKEVHQHYPIGQPSGAVIDSDDVRDIIQIEIVGYGFYDGNPDNPDQNSKCSIGGTDYTSSNYCFAKFSDEDWDYLATLLAGINKWGNENGTNIPLTSSVTWTGDVNSLRMSPSDFDAATGIVAHMHAPDQGNHGDTGNIWPLVQAAINRVQCNSDGNANSISGAKNADKQASEVGPMWFSNSDTGSMKTLLENYGDLAYRTGQAYGIPWIAILVQGRYEDSGVNGFENMCGAANFWGIACYNGTEAGGGSNAANLGEGFTLYGETVHNGRYEEALKQTDPLEYLDKLGKGGWRVGNDGYVGYTKEQLTNMGDSIDALKAYIETSEGKAVIAEFGAASCNDGSDLCGNGGSNIVGGDVLAAVEFIIDLANKNGSTYIMGGGHSSIGDLDNMLNGSSPVNVDCTGFAGLVYYKTYGSEFTVNDIFATCSIIPGMPSYREVPRSEVSPGDIFAYDPGLACGAAGHGGIVIEASNGIVTKIAETGGVEGRSGSNYNIGYSSGESSYSIMTMNGPEGHFFRWKGASE